MLKYIQLTYKSNNSQRSSLLLLFFFHSAFQSLLFSARFLYCMYVSVCVCMRARLPQVQFPKYHFNFCKLFRFSFSTHSFMAVGDWSTDIHDYKKSSAHNFFYIWNRNKWQQLWIFWTKNFSRVLCAYAYGYIAHVLYCVYELSFALNGSFYVWQKTYTLTFLQLWSVQRSIASFAWIQCSFSSSFHFLCRVLYNFKLPNKKKEEKSKQ